MKKITLTIFLVFALLIAASACVADLPLPDGNDPAPEENPLPPADEPLPPLAAVKARALLAQQLGLTVDQIEILETSQMDWSDSCLGLGGPAESCLAAITPGWQVSLLAEGEVYVARTDELGDSIRFEEFDVAFPFIPPLSGDDEGSVPEAARKAQAALAEKLGISAEAIEIVSYEHTDWPDGCLGLADPGMMCTMALVPGWRVELSTDGQSFIARTDETGFQVKFE